MLGAWLAATVALCGCRFGFDTDTAAQQDAAIPADAPADTFALIDGPPGSVTASWGEDPTATYRNVTRDTFLSSNIAITEDERTLNFGTTDPLEIADDKVILIRFDVTALPAGATILSASLRLSITTGGHSVITLHRVLEAWNEGTRDGSFGDPNWNMRSLGILWSNAGARTPSSSEGAATASIPANASGEVTIDLPVAVLEGWLATPASNLGLSLIAASADDTNITSREGAAGFRPLLVVTYLP